MILIMTPFLLVFLTIVVVAFPNILKGVSPFAAIFFLLSALNLSVYNFMMAKKLGTDPKLPIISFATAALILIGGAIFYWYILNYAM